jgi:hypothetical protein
VNEIAAMQVAALLTVAVVSRLPATVAPLSPTLPADVKTLDLEVWEIFRIFYAAIIGALNDGTDWPVPPLLAPQGAGAGVANALNPAGPLVSQILPAVQKGLAGTSAGPILAGILAGLTGNAAASAPVVPALPAASSIPNPGTQPAAAAMPTATPTSVASGS